jgi:hypothetical protein
MRISSDTVILSMSCFHFGPPSTALMLIDLQNGIVGRPLARTPDRKLSNERLDSQVRSGRKAAVFLVRVDGVAESAR